MTMKRDDADNLNDPLGNLLAHLDASLAEGFAPGPEEEPDLSPDELRVYRLAREGMVHLERAWPRTDSSAGATPTFDAEPSFDWLTGTGRIGKFQIHRELGRGGGGIVFHATDTTTQREVALKLPRLEVLLDPNLRQRFLHEARLTLGLDHPHLAPACEADEVGATCYLAMPYTGEKSLSAWLEERAEPVPARTAAAVTAALARGVDYLHERQILHRDIKPGNVLLSPAPAAPLPDPELAAVGLPRLTDFGLAKVFDHLLPESVRSGTTGGLIVGTPEYMAPEQADSQLAQLGRATDVYGLGAVLYELLTGQPPFQGRNRFHTLRKMLGEEPAPPRKLRKVVPRGLEAICLKCLEKDPRRRYGTARELADDLQRFLDGRRPHARPTPWRRRLLKWARRRPWVAGGLVLALIASVLAPAGFFLHRAAESREHARQVERVWQARGKGLELCNRGEVGPGLLWLAKALADKPAGEEDLEELLRLDLDAWRVRLPALTALLPHPDRVRAVQFSPDGRTALTLCGDKMVRLWNAETGQPVAPPLEHTAFIWKARFGADGQTVRSVCADGFFWTWSAKTGKVLDKELAQSAQGIRPGVRPLQKKLLREFEDGEPPGHALPATGDADTLRARARELLLSLLGQQTDLLAFSPDGERLASWSGDSGVKLWKLPPRLPGPLVHPLADRATQICPDGFRRAKLSYGGIMAAAFTPDGSQILSGGIDTTVRLWNPATGRSTPMLVRHDDAVECLAVHATSQAVLVGSQDSVARLWDLKTGQPLGPPLEHPHPVGGVAFSPKGDTIATGFLGHGPLRLWDIQTGQPEGAFGPMDGVFDLTFSPDGQAILAGSSPDAYWCDRRTGQWRRLLHGSSVYATAYHPAGHLFVTGSREGELRWWDAQTLESLATVVAHGNRIRRAGFSPTGEVVATIGWDEKLLFWHSRTRQQVGPTVPMPGVPQSLAFHPKGRTVVVGCRNGQMHFACAPQPLEGTSRQVALWVQVMTGTELDSQGMPQPLTAKAWQQRHEELQAAGGPLR